MLGKHGSCLVQGPAVASTNVVPPVDVMKGDKRLR